ncbi:putative small secreted protein [Sphingobium sp. B1D3A]|uniref:Small secreted protein n=1 Tax=Sphingobium lignivorans TaxID=2735886 RepID=A0ABR6NB06_9SPHN|nr:putative small secreted protein [Sphingobium lignivorans]
MTSRRRALIEHGNRSVGRSFFHVMKDGGNKMTRNAIIGFLLGATLMLNACATVKGVGRDIESVGEAGSEAIDQ